MAHPDTPPPDHPRLRFATRVTVGALSLAAAVGLFIVLFVTRPRVEVSDDHRAPVPVLVFEAQRVPVRRQWQGYGTIEPIRVADVPARVTTTVAAVPDDMRAGRAVERGELLMELDDADFEQDVRIHAQRVVELEAQLEQWRIERERLAAQLAIDEQDAALAEAEYERVRRITERLAGNQQQLDSAQRALLAARRALAQSREALERMVPRRQALEAQLAAQQAQLDLARLNVERCTIRSPIAGVLAAVDVEEGEQVQPGARVARVVGLDRVEAPLRLPAAARQSIALGDAVRIRSTSEHAITCEAPVARISPVDDIDTRTVTVYVEVDQHHLASAFGTARGTGLLLPGAFVSGVVTAHHGEQRWIIPRRSVRGGRLQVVRDGQLVSRQVSVDFVIEGEQPDFGLPDTQWAVLARNDTLTDGELVLIDGSVSLTDGQPVEPVLPPAVSGSGTQGEGLTDRSASHEGPSASRAASPRSSAGRRGGP